MTNSPVTGMKTRNEPAMTPGSANGNDDVNRFVEKFPHADLVKASAHVERSIALLDKNVYLPLILATLALDLQRCIVTPRS